MASLTTSNVQSLPPPSADKGLPSMAVEELETKTMDWANKVASDSQYEYGELYDPSLGKTIGALTVSSSLPVEVIVPKYRVWNPARTYWAFTRAISAQNTGSNAYCWVNPRWADVERFEVYRNDDESWKPIDLQELGRLMEVNSAWFMDKKDYMNRTEQDAIYPNRDEDLNPFHVSVLNSDNPLQGRRHDLVRYQRSELATAHTQRSKYHLRDLKSTLFEKDRDFVLPFDLAIRMTLAPGNKLAHRGSSATFPDADAANVDPDTTFTYTNVRLCIAYERNPQLIKEMLDELAKGMDFAYPLCQIHRKVISAGNENKIPVIIKGADMVRKVICAPFHNADKWNDRYNLNILSDDNDLETASVNLDRVMVLVDNVNAFGKDVYLDPNSDQPHTWFDYQAKQIEASPIMHDKTSALMNFCWIEDYTDAREELAVQGLKVGSGRNWEIQFQNVTATAAVNRTDAQVQTRNYYLIYHMTRFMRLKGDRSMLVEASY